MQIGQVLEAKLKEARLAIEEPIETFSTPRRLTVRSARIAERQTDLEELVTGPPVSAAFGADGKLTPAGAGFAKKQGVSEDQIERITTPKGEYIGVRKHQRGRAAVDVLPDVLTGVLARHGVPETDAMGRRPQRRQGRAAVRPADSVDPVSVRRPRRAVHDRAIAAGADHSRPGDQRRGHQPMAIAS